MNTMELDLYTEDFLLAQEWDLDLPVVQPDGQYGDLKPGSRYEDGLYKSTQLQGPIEEPEANNQDPLGLEWIESDLSTFLDALDTTQKLLPLEGNILPPDSDDAAEVKIGFGIESPIVMQDALLGSLDLGSASLSQGVPDLSPAEVKPVITFEGYDMPQALSPSADETIIDPADFISRSEMQSISSIEDLQMSETAMSPLSHDGDSILSTPGPSSPESNLSSIVETSPELYKIITTSSGDARFSPYSSKAKQSKSKSVKKRKPAEPIPEHVIMGHVNKKDRKKMQNKNAAIRYRMKKKEEAICIKSEVEELEDVNSSLKGKVDDLQREIKYMKNLMEEVYKAKGISIK